MGLFDGGWFKQDGVLGEKSIFDFFDEVPEEKLASKRKSFLTPDNPASANEMNYVGIQFEEFFTAKWQRLAKYREMSYFPEVSDAIDHICDDAIVVGDDGNIVDLEIKVDEVPEHVADVMNEAWDDMIINMLNFNERGWDYFRKWLIDIELFARLIYEDDEQGNHIDVVGVKFYPAYNVLPQYNDDGEVVEYMVGNVDVNQDKTNPGYFIEGSTEAVQPEDMIYINYGDWGSNVNDVKGFLESSIRPYNMLKNLEDSLIVYRLIRAPLRRVWNVDVGKMPKRKADQYLKEMMESYRSKIKYDSSTGAMDSAKNFQSMQEDIWFAKKAEGNGTEVNNIGGDMNLGDIDDVKLVMDKLYKSLKMPSSRYTDTNTGTYSSGKSGEVLQEEIKFARFIDRHRNKFLPFLRNLYLRILEVRDVDELYISKDLFRIEFNKMNLFEQYKEAEILEMQFGLLSHVEGQIYDPVDNPKGLFAKELVMKDIFMMSDEQYAKNEELKRKQKAQDDLGDDAEVSDESDDLDISAEFENDSGGGGLGGMRGGAPTSDMNTEPDSSDGDADVSDAGPETIDAGDVEGFIA